MNEYLKSLNKFKSICFTPKERILLKKIALYINGDISITELIENLSEKHIEFVVMVLNKVANDAKRNNRYFIELPNDLDFNVSYPYSLYRGDTKRFGLLHNTLEFEGPKIFRVKKVDSKHFLELTGRFYYPYGIAIIRNDWLKILSKYPYLADYLYKISLNSMKKYSLEEVKKYVDDYLNTNINNHFENLLDENINSIRFVEDKRYFDVYSVMDGRATSFDKMVLTKKKR